MRFEQDAGGVAQQAMVRGRIRMQISGETTASARVQPFMAITMAADDHGDRTEAVVDDFEKRRPQVEVGAAAAGQRRDRGDLGRFNEPPDTLHKDVDADAEQQQCLQAGGEDFHPLVTPGPAARPRMGNHVGGEQGQTSPAASVSRCPASASSASAFRQVAEDAGAPS